MKKIKVARWPRKSLIIAQQMILRILAREYIFDCLVKDKKF